MVHIATAAVVVIVCMYVSSHTQRIQMVNKQAKQTQISNGMQNSKLQIIVKSCPSPTYTLAQAQLTVFGTYMNTHYTPFLWPTSLLDESSQLLRLPHGDSHHPSLPA